MVLTLAGPGLLFLLTDRISRKLLPLGKHLFACTLDESRLRKYPHNRSTQLFILEKSQEGTGNQPATAEGQRDQSRSPRVYLGTFSDPNPIASEGSWLELYTQ